MALEIREIPIGGDVKHFLDVVDYIYRDDPNYVRPLDMDVKKRLSRKNPFFQHAEGILFVALRNGWCVGRCSAQIDREHLARYRDDTGFFGFLDTVEDEEVASQLLEAACRWLKDRGMKAARGPFSLSINEEMGCLVDGFDMPPMVMMPHHRPYQADLIHKAGFDKKKDVLAWRYETKSVSSRVRKAYEAIESLPEVTSRAVEVSHMDRDVQQVMDVFNDAWSDNWGFVPYTPAELRDLAADMKLILDPAITRIAYVNNEAAAIALAIPNVNEVIHDFNGKLLPTGLPKLIYRLKVRRPHTARLAFLGIRKKFRNQRKYAALSLYLYALLNDAGRQRGYRWGELSWTLEDNAAVNAGIKMMGGKVYKKYRVFERSLDSV